MSAASSKTPEPSMEEILASIRRIIADDQEPAAATASPAEPAPAPPAPAAREPEPDEPDTGDDDDADILDLAEIAPPRRPPPPGPVPSFRDAETQRFVPPRVETPPRPSPAPVRSPEPPPRAPEPPLRAPEPPRSSPALDRLVSAQTDAVVSGSFDLLANAVLSQNARTIEDLVREMMRPMLKAWLDDNLPTIVERLVRAEIERVARGGR